MCAQEKPLFFCCLLLLCVGSHINFMTAASTQKEENFVVYNHLFKSKQTLIDSIIAFHDRTIRLDSIKKYPDGYCRSFFKRSTVLDKYYREEPNGSDIIFDQRDKQILAVEWRITGDTVCANFCFSLTNWDKLYIDIVAVSVIRTL